MSVILLLRNMQLHHLLTRMFGQFFQRLRKFELCLDLGPELNHFPPGLSVLAPHQLDDGGGEGHPDEDVHEAHQHVGRPVRPQARHHVTEPNSGHGDETEIKRVNE